MYYLVCVPLAMWHLYDPPSLVLTPSISSDPEANSVIRDSSMSKATSSLNQLTVNLRPCSIGPAKHLK